MSEAVGDRVLPPQMREVWCSEVYHQIRDGVDRSSLRLGEGLNLYGSSKAVDRHLVRIMQDLVRSSNLCSYESETESRDRALIASLLNQYLDANCVSSRNVVPTNGSHEAISIVCGYAAASDLGGVFPLPLYYAYEQSSLRSGMPVHAYYNNEGSIHWLRQDPAKLMHVVLLPNVVSGTIFPRPLPLPSVPALSVIDCVYQLGEHGSESPIREQLRSLVRELGWEKVALIFTVSKDLSLPGLRSGLLVTGNPDLIRYARADRFERAYAVSPLIGRVLALYFALLLLRNAASEGRLSAAQVDIRTAFSEAGGRFLSVDDIAHVLGYFDEMADRFRANLRCLQDGCYPLSLAPGWLPHTGYSIFPEIQRDFGGPAEFLSAVRSAGIRYALKLNPAYLFGGNPEAWTALYPGQYRLRVNLSESPRAFERVLARLNRVVENGWRSS